MVRWPQPFDHLLVELEGQRPARLADYRRLKLLLVDPEQLVDLKLHILTNPQPLRIEILQCGKMKEYVVAKVLAAYEPELAVRNDGDDLTDAH